jgi:hypothetical protein
MPFRLEVERLKRVEADLAAVRGVAGNRLGRAAQLRDQFVYGLASRSRMEGDRMYAIRPDRHAGPSILRLRL